MKQSITQKSAKHQKYKTLFIKKYVHAVYYGSFIYYQLIPATPKKEKLSSV